MYEHTVFVFAFSVLMIMKPTWSCYVFPIDSTDPCRDKVCPVGARCVPTPDGRSATCVCPKYCPQYGDHTASRPVCGTDNRDYKDQCEMRKSACERGIEIAVKYHGACDPCENVQCVEPEVCQLDSDRKPVCRCGDTCSLEFTPVCGSDGKTYSNECSLRQESCRTKKSHRIIYRGKCSSGVNPCSSVMCLHGEQCVISKFGIAQCECVFECEPAVRLVCGINGQTYDSICHLQKAACLSKIEIKVAYTGECGISGPCSNHICEQGAVCVERGGTIACECPLCSAEFDPVCGSDGISYSNKCKLQLEACQHKRDITVLYKGLCNGCENKKCDHFSVCEIDSQGEAKCVCLQLCPDIGSPVCGTDGVTYKNDCELRKTVCNNRLSIQVAYKGNCDQCQGVKCKLGARCEAGVCVCPTECPSSGTSPEEPVCASNMKTYFSECEMQRQSCLPNPPLKLTVLFYGDCNDRFGAGQITTPLTPGSIPQPPPRATDVAKHSNDACRDIHCDYDATCELGPDGFPRCSCLFDCSKEETNLICGSDLRIYQSMCAMKMEACQRQNELRLRPLELCQGMEVKPCNGELPVRDLSTGQEFDCGNGPLRQDCPSDSYCHQTQHFAKCCRKASGVYLKSCEDSWYGCCPDNKTPSQGPANAGCPSMCGCNKLGSYSDTCDPDTEQCNCKPGVGGLKCDRCEPGYWGLPKITSGQQGCLPCGCSLFGSVREDCEQMTGRCVCKPGVQGQKCTVCSGPKQVLGPNGCVSADMTTPVPTSCAELNCYFGAVCEENEGHAECVCTITCANDATKPQQVVCGNDGQTFGSECQLKLYACRYQKDIAVQALGPCKENMFVVGTEWPVRRWTSGNRFTEPEDVSSPLSKSTRHLLVPDQRNSYSHYGEEISNLITSGHLKGVFHIPGYKPTPATVQVYTALLGDLCSSDFDCTIENSVCASEACTCDIHFTETSDRQQCIRNEVNILPTSQLHACSSHPCENGGTCERFGTEDFTCICLPGYTGNICGEMLVPKMYEIAAFNRNSFVRLKRLKAYHKLTLEMEFKTYANDGILFYNQQHSDGSGDFVSLAIVNGHLEFRYNLGNGPIVLQSRERVQMRKFHRIIAKRYQRDGLLQLDNNEAVAGQSQGTLRALDLLEDAYIGYVPTTVSKVFENLGTSSGLMGCIRHLKIGRKNVELHEGRDSMVEEVDSVKECGDNPCANLPCQNGATCHPIDAHKFRCACSSNFTGDLCEMRVNPCVSNPCIHGSTCEPLPQGGFTCKCLPGHKGHICQHLDTEYVEFGMPQFSGDSYIEASKLENVGRAFSLEIWFLPLSNNGVLVYNGQLTTGKGDFISLNLMNGHVQFRFDLGSGIANITTPETITIGKWHSVRASRVDKDGSLQLDNGTIVHGASGPPLTELNLELPLYIGGVPNITDTSRDSGIITGFTGSMQRIFVNGQLWTKLGIERYKVEKYRGPLCPPTDSPCQNGGICIPLLDSFLCKCKAGYGGRHCNTLEQQQANDFDIPVRFDGKTYIHYPKKLSTHRSSNMSTYTNFTNLVEDYWEEDDIEQEIEMEDEIENDEGDMYDEEDYEFFDERKGKRTNRFEFSLRTHEPNGLLLWTNEGNSLQGSFIAVGVVDGFPELCFNLGKKEVYQTVRSKIQVNDGEWHTLLVHRQKRMAYIQVDNEVPVKTQAKSETTTLLNYNSGLWIGGAATLLPGLSSSFYLNYIGCLQRLIVDKKPVNLLRLNSLLPTNDCLQV